MLGLGVLSLLVLLGLMALSSSRVTSAQESGDKLAPGVSDPCPGDLQLLPSSGLCTHGPDAMPQGFEAASVDDQAVGGASVSCDGDGTSGNRVEVIYARPSDRPDRYAEKLLLLQYAVSDLDQIYRNSSADTRHVRFVTEPVTNGGCVVPIRNVELSPAGDDTLDDTIVDLQAGGYNRTDRKYLVFVDAGPAVDLCGNATTTADTRRDAANQSNGGPGYARVDPVCWSGQLAAHELIHTFGGVQFDAPHASRGWHCTDEYDAVCFSDFPYFPAMQVVCEPEASQDFLLDCGKDDYFSVNPPVGNYLAQSWNTANNRFLVGAVDQPPLPPPANDEITRAQRPDARPYSDKRVVYSATSTGDSAPSCFGATPSQSVWYATTPATAGTLTVDTFGTPYDTVLSVWTGSPGSLMEAACNDDTPDGVYPDQSRVSLPVTAGTTYYVMANAYAAGGANTLTLHLNGPAETSTLVPALTLDKEKSKFNGYVTATLSGFAPNSAVTLTWPRLFAVTATGAPSTDLLAEGTTDGVGRATLRFRTPLEPFNANGYIITASDTKGRNATDTLRVIPRIMLNEEAGPTTTRLRVYFYGFSPNERIEVRWHSGPTNASGYVVIKTLTVAATGRASSIVTIPGNASSGEHLIVGKVVGVARSASTPFELTAGGGSVDETATPTPTPTVTPTLTVEASATAERDGAEPTPTATPEATVTPKPTAVSTEVPTAEPTPTETSTSVPNASPVADAGDDQTVADADGSGDEEVQLDGSASIDPEGAELTYAWSVDGVEVGTGPTPGVTLPVGAATVVLTVTDGQDATATDEVSITVEPLEHTP